jgi:phospholipase/lecithinase/hemolysin
MKTPTLAFGLLTLSLSVTYPAQAAIFSEIYSFGDSLVDRNRAFVATSGLVPFYSEGDGRFSNGLLWNEYLGNSLGIPSNPATNFAVAGATTGTINTIKENPLLPPGLPNVDNLVGLEQQILGYITNTPIADANGLYLIWAGANDYLGAGIQDPSIPVTNLLGAVTALAGQGAKNFLVVNLPSLGQLPSTLNTPASTPLNLLTQAHNGGLSQGIDLLRLSLPSDVNLRLLDVNALFLNVAQNPAAFGFTNITEGCRLVLCPNPSEFLFWDEIHPTTRAHQLIAQSATQALGIPEGSLVWGILGIGTIAFIRRRP